MSLETWKEEFYPSPADECPEQEAIEHSLRQWRGLRSENLRKHSVEFEETIARKVLVDVLPTSHSGFFIIDAFSCSLCQIYYNDAPSQTAEAACKKCPLAKFLGKPCDKGDDSPYHQFVSLGDPEPTIEALEGTLAMVKEQS